MAAPAVAPSPVDWGVATAVGSRLAGRDPIERSYHYETLQRDFDELAPEAEALVEEATGLRSLHGPARIRVTDRPGWVKANVAGFSRLLRPVTDKLAPRLDRSPIAPVGRFMAGVEVGTLLGWMAGRVLGQYDLLLDAIGDGDAGEADTDAVWIVGPNLLALEKRFDLPPREFRLWIAIHELTHRAQFTGVPWMQAHYLALVEQVVSQAEPDLGKLVAALARSARDALAGRNPLHDGGLPALIAGPAELEALRKVGGLMSLLEGHGDVTMNRAGADRIPSADRFARILSNRRADVDPVRRLLQQLLGLDAKLRQYEAGERFVEHVEGVGGRSLLDLVWSGPEQLPTRLEIDDPDRWIARIGAAA